MGSEKHLWFIFLPSVGFILGLFFIIDGLTNHSFKSIIGGAIMLPIFLGLLIYVTYYFFLRKEKKSKKTKNQRQRETKFY